MRVPARSTAYLLCSVGLALLLGLASTPALGAAPSGRAGAKVGSCAGFTNRIGMTNKLIRIGNASDVSGPVPGLNTSAQLATKAYVAYFNSTSSICGRKLALTSYDSATDSSANNTAYTSMCTKVFAAVGSMSEFDAGGSKPTQACRLPDLRVASTSAARNSCTTCFGVEATRSGEVPNSVADYLVASHPAAVQKAAALYINIGDVPTRAVTRIKGEQQRGLTFVYTSGVDIADFNYGPYVQAMQSKGVKLVQFFGGTPQAARLAQAMAQANFHPDVYQVESNAYVPEYAALGGADVEGTITAIDFYPLTAPQRELNLYRTWLDNVSPGSKPTRAGLFAWSAAKLFVKEARALGAKLTRSNLNTALRSVTRWTGGGLHPPMAIGTKHVSPCVRFLSLHSGTWISIGGTSYRCSGVTTVS